MSAIFYLFAFPIGIALVITKKDGLPSVLALYRLLDIVVNIGRSVPFLILLILVIHDSAHSRKKPGSTATIVPLVIASPFIARLIESSLRKWIGVSKRRRAWELPFRP